MLSSDEAGHSSLLPDLRKADQEIWMVPDLSEVWAGIREVQVCRDIHGGPHRSCQIPQVQEQTFYREKIRTDDVVDHSR